MTEAKLTSAKKLMAEKAKKAAAKTKPAVKTVKTAKPAAKVKEQPAVNSASSMLKDFYSNLNAAANTARAV